MTRVRIDPTLDPSLRISRFLSFPQFAELMVQHRMQLGGGEARDAKVCAQHWHVGRAADLPAGDAQALCDAYSIRIESDIGALADALFADSQTALHLQAAAPSPGGPSWWPAPAGDDQLGMRQVAGAAPGDVVPTPGQAAYGVALIVASAPGVVETDGAYPRRSVPVLVDIGRLLKGVSVASAAPAHFAELILRMVRDHVWLDVTQYHSNVRELAVSL